MLRRSTSTACDSRRARVVKQRGCVSDDKGRGPGGGGRGEELHVAALERLDIRRVARRELQSLRLPHTPAPARAPLGMPRSPPCAPGE